MASIVTIIEVAAWYFKTFEPISVTGRSSTIDPLLELIARILVLFGIVTVAVVGIKRRYSDKAKSEGRPLCLDNELLSNAMSQIATLNEELRASNEELFANNEQLLDLNESLTAANQTIARQKDEQLNRVLDSCNDVIWSLDLTDRNESYLSHSAEKVYEEPIEELLKRPRFWMENVVDTDRELKEASQRALEQHGITECTYRIDLPGGRKWIHDRLRLIRDEAGVPVRIEGIASDVTALKESEARIRTERNLLRSIIDNIPDGIFVVDRQSCNVIQNRAAYEMLGARSEQETVGKTVVDYFGERGKKMIEDNERIFSTGIPSINNELQIPAAGEVKTLLYSKVPLLVDGTIIGIVGIARDITERIKSKEALNKYRQNLEIVFNNSSDRFILVDENAQIVLFNKQFKEFCETFTGITPTVGMSLLLVLPVARQEENKVYIDRALQGETGRLLGRVEKNGSPYYFDIRYNPVRLEERVTHVTISALDVTEQIRQELIATRHRENLDIIFQTSTDFFILLNTELEIVLFNKSFLDYTREFVKVPAYLGMNYFEVISLNRVDVVKGLITRCMNGESVKTVAEAVWPAGTYYYNVHYIPVFKDGKVTHITISSTNITEQRKQELIAARYRENLDIIFKNTNDHFVLIEASGKIVFFNSKFSDFIFKTLGFRPEPGMSYIDLFPRHQKAFAADLFTRALAGESISSEVNVPDTDEYFEIRYIPVNQDGTITHVSFSAIDMTQRKKQEALITQYKQNLSIIFENSTDYFLLLDRSETVVLFNHRYMECVRDRIGIDPQEGMNFSEVIIPEWKEQAQLMVRKALAGESRTSELTHDTKNNGQYFTARYMPVTQNGTVTHVCYIITDITEKVKAKEHAEQLAAALEKERELVEMKSRFVSNASHEFRTPLSTILIAAGFVKKFKHQMQPEEVDRKLNSVEVQVRHMTSLLDDILTLGKSESGKLKVNLTLLEIRPLFDTIIRDLTAINGTSIRINTTYNCSQNSVLSDEGLMRNIVINLLTNAIKFSGGSEVVDVNIVCTEDTLHLTIQDYGLGIPQEDMSKLFEPFFRAENAAVVRGTGLGLSIVKRAVELLQGEIDVHSEIGKGTSFTVLLPIH